MIACHRAYVYSSWVVHVDTYPLLQVRFATNAAKLISIVVPYVESFYITQ